MSLALVGGTAVLILLAGCGGDDDGDDMTGAPAGTTAGTPAAGTTGGTTAGTTASPAAGTTAGSELDAGAMTTALPTGSPCLATDICEAPPQFMGVVPGCCGAAGVCGGMNPATQSCQSMVACGTSITGCINENPCCTPEMTCGMTQADGSCMPMETGGTTGATTAGSTGGTTAAGDTTGGTQAGGCMDEAQLVSLGMGLITGGCCTPDTNMCGAMTPVGCLQYSAAASFGVNIPDAPCP